MVIQARHINYILKESLIVYFIVWVGTINMFLEALKSTNLFM